MKNCKMIYINDREIYRNLKKVEILWDNHKCRDIKRDKIKFDKNKFKRIKLRNKKLKNIKSIWNKNSKK